MAVSSSVMMPALVKPQAERGMILKDVPVPEIGKNDVLIRVLKTGICGTDVHIYQWDEWAQRRIHPPLVVGHEFMGMVERVGEAVDEFKPGDLVSGEGHIGCGHCFFCRTGLGHICRTMKIIGVDRDGCFARFISMPQSNVWRLKPGIPHEVAAIFDPYGNAMHTVMAQPVNGRTVAVIGAGAIGLMACAIAQAAGALNVLVVEPHANKREMAHKLGLRFTYDPKVEGWEKGLLERTPDGIGVDVALEMSGSAPGIHTAFKIVRAGGDVAMLGIPPTEVGINLAEEIIFKSVTVRGINGRLMYQTWYQCERFLLDQKLDLMPLITHQCGYKDFQEAFGMLERGEAVKIVMSWED